MKKVFIIHGFNGQPNGGWRPWLMGELARHDIYACALPMPKPEAPDKNEWIETISKAVGNPDEEIFLVGHSLGVPAILRYLETLGLGSKIGGAFLVSGPVEVIKRSGYDNVNKFLEGSFNFEHINSVCKKILVIHGEKDKIVPLSDARLLSERLYCDLVLIPDGEHLNDYDGYYRLPELLDVLLKMIEKK
jgi:uncharacterized protein